MDGSAPNCGEEHKDNKCPHPPVAVGDRKCWTCGKKGHSNRDCPDRKKKPFKNVNDEIEEGVRLLGTLREGFTHPKKTGKPMPRDITMKDFTHENQFKALGAVDAPRSQKERKAMARATAKNQAPPDKCVQVGHGSPC